MLRKCVATINKTSQVILISLIKTYQTLLSPLLGPRCRFYPTCSCYAIEAISKRGVGVGLLLTLQRILRCHPLSPGGDDPVPPAKKIF